MHGARAHQSLGHVAEFAFPVPADRLGRFDVTEGHGDPGDRPRLDLLATAQFAFDHPVALARRLLRRHTYHPFFATPYFVATRRLADLLTARRGQDTERLAVLGHRASRDID